MMTVCSPLFHHPQQQRDTERETVRVRGCKSERERRKREECREPWGPQCVLSDDMRGNELPDFMHQRRDAPHRLDSQRFLPRIGEMRPPYNPSSIHSIPAFEAHSADLKPAFHLSA